MNNFFIKASHGQLECAYDSISKNKNSDFIAIICHPHPLYQGTMYNKVVTTISRALKTFSIESYRFNYRGVMNSTGEYGNGIGELEDLMTVYKYVKEKHAQSKIILCGFSFGGAIAYMANSKINNLSAMISVAPSIDRFDLLPFEEPKVPWLVVQGVDDDTVNPDSVFNFTIKQTQSQLLLVKMNEVGHFFHGKLIDLKKEIEYYLEPRLNNLL